MSLPKMTGCTIINRSTILDEEGMRNCFEDHLQWLTQRGRTHRVDKHNAYKYSRDLSAYLLELNIEIGLHWLIMRMNNMYYNWEFGEETELLYLPDIQDVERLIALHTSISR